MPHAENMADKFPEVTDFSRRFGTALAAVMEARGVSQSAVARAIGKKAGASYVSERVRGLRAVDTDVIAGVAIVAEVSPQTITREVLAMMRTRDTKVINPSLKTPRAGSRKRPARAPRE